MDIISYILSRAYVNKTLVGMGALKGSPAMISSIVDNPDGTHDITFSWKDNSDVTHTSVLTVANGETPTITSTEIEGGHTLTFATTDPSQSVSFNIMDGEEGQRGVSVIRANVDNNNYLTLELSDGNIINAGQIKTVSMVDNTLSLESENPVQNKVITKKFDEYKTAFTGTKEEWNALTSEQQNVYDIMNITNDGDVLNLGIYLEKKTAMPVASEDVANRIYLYTGATTQDYKKGVVYQCVSDGQDPATYSWVALIDFGTAATKNSTDRVSPNNTDLVESQSVYSAINTALSSIYSPRGEITCAELTSSLLISENIGNVYETSDSGTTTALFLQGAGHTIAVGSNVGIINAGKGRILFNLMANAFDLTSYQKKDLTQAVEGATTVEGALGVLSTNKADKVSSATNGNFAGLDANGNLTDSGKKASDFATATETAEDIDSLKETFTKNGAHNLMPMTLAGIKAANTSGTWSGNTYTRNDVSITIQTDNDGNVIGIKLNGTTTGNTWFKLATNAAYAMGAYKLNGLPSTINSGVTLRWLDSNSTLIDRVFQNQDKQITLSTAYTNTFFDIQIPASATFSNEIIYPMLRLASDTDSTFEPYAKTNQQLTRETTGLIDNVNVCGVHNLNGTEYKNGTTNGITYAVADDGTVTANGTLTDTESVAPMGHYFVAPFSAQVILTGGVSSKFHIYAWDSTDSARPWKDSTKTERQMASSASYTEGVSFYIEKGHTYSMRPRIQGTSGQTISGVVFKPMLRLASDIDTTFEPYAMTNRELTNALNDRISATNGAWPGDTLTFKNLPKSNKVWYEFTACASLSSSYFVKGYIILGEDNIIYVNGKQGDFTVAYNQDGDLVITLPISGYWLYDMRKSGDLT